MLPLLPSVFADAKLCARFSPAPVGMDLMPTLHDEARENAAEAEAEAEADCSSPFLPDTTKTTGVAMQGLPDFFTDMKLSDNEEEFAKRIGTEWVLLHKKWKNKELNETLNNDVIQMMMNPPPEYNSDYHKQVNIALLTCMKTLDNKINHYVLGQNRV